MAVSDIDFEGTDNQGNEAGNNSNPDVSTNKEDVTNFGGNEVDDITNNPGSDTNPDNTGDGDKGTDNNNNNPSTGELSVGDQIEVDGITYTVAENGDLVDDKGNVFKESKDVAEWLKSVNVEDNEESSITLSSIQESLGVTITDKNGNPVTFTDDAAGVKAYVDSVIELKSNELQQAAINRLYADNPLLKQFQDYVQLNGTPRGFGEIPDRSGIKLDKDKAYRKEIETKAAAPRQQEAEDVKNYWEKVNNMINSRVINGYKIPDSFTKEIDGKKVVITPNDFFNYLSNANIEDENGKRLTAYQRDLNNLSDDEFLAREMLDAWLMFTGGTYKDLIDMAVKEEQVRKLVVKSKQNRSAKTVKVVKKQTGKTNIEDIIL